MPASYWLLVLLAAPPLAAQDPGARARALFLANCASCHGESGDGKGTTPLDRPARSFMDGGFSFGNTPEALYRTISTGIPGTPMPGFDASLSEAERRLVADYVVTLGPPLEAVKEEDMVLAVHDRPLIVRGLLPPLGEGLPAHPRGLLIGDPSGITFEYRVDDVRLLALRLGGFVKRTDWTGRGGTALEPLGKVVQLVGEGKPDPLFSLAAGVVPLAARLSGTRVDGARVVLDYHLIQKGRELAHVEESPCVLRLPTGTGYARRFRITGSRPAHLALADPTQSARSGAMIAGKRGEWFLSLDDGAAQFDALRIEARRWSREEGALILELAPGERAEVELANLPVSAWGETLESSPGSSW
jgi:mono/diheme cytochrome c family protein